MKFLLSASFALALVFFLWSIQANKDPAIQYAKHPHHWFVAIKHNNQTTTGFALAEGVNSAWQVTADLGFIVERGIEPYWDSFMLLTSDTDHRAPIDFNDDIDDAYLVRLKPYPVPPLGLSFFYALHKIGILKANTTAPSSDIDSSAVRAGIGPSQDSIRALFDRPFAQKPVMVNFLKFYDKARYSEHTKETTPNISGQQAYGRYGDVASKTVFSVGGEYVMGGKIIEVLRAAQRGPSVGDWDEIAVMQYPNQTSILTMGQVQEYADSMVHRNAGLERTVIISSRN